MVGPDCYPMNDYLVIYSSNAAPTTGALHYCIRHGCIVVASNYPVDTIDEAMREFEIVLERNARGRMRVRRPPQPAVEDPWVPPPLQPRAVGIAWPVMLRRFRGQRS